MQTIITEQTDGHAIVKGFGKMLPDPKATQAKCLPLIQALDEATAVKTKAQERNANTEKANGYMMQARSSYFGIAKKMYDENPEQPITRDLVLGTMNQAQKSIFDENEKLNKAHLEADKIIEKDLIGLSKAMNEKAKEVLRGNPEYFEPKTGEIPKTDEDIEALKILLSGRGLNEQIDGDGNIIEDWRGCSFWFKADGDWIESEKISRLGDTVKTVVVNEYEAQALRFEELGSVEKAEIAVQKNKERIAGLEPGEKLDEKNSKIDSAASSAALMSQKLEIQGDPGFLEKAQAVYQADCLVIEEIYK